MDIPGTLQLLNSGHVRERKRTGSAQGLSLLVGFEMAFFLVKLGANMCLVGSAAVLIMMVISSGTVPFPPLVEIREHPEFNGLLEMDKS